MTGASMASQDRFFVWFGRIAAILSGLFVFTVAVFCLYLAYQAELDSRRPAFTIPPDSSSILHKKAAP